MSNKNSCVLLIGKCPPPIGGVTVHFSRLVHLLRGRFDLLVLNLSFQSLLYIARQTVIQRKAVVHLHSSSPYFRFLFAFGGRLLHLNLVITYHGSLGRFGRLGNFFDLASLWLCRKPLVLNDSSLRIGLQFNRATQKISAFVPPLEIQELPRQLLARVSVAKQMYDCVFCTCAFNVTFDSRGKEIYGISELVEIFRHRPQFCLLVSDPSKKYHEFLRQSVPIIPPNVIFLSGEHCFMAVLRKSDVFIRHTTTDGDSLSVSESLFLRRLVLATDVVSRPSGVMLYSDVDGLSSYLDRIHELLANSGGENFKVSSDEILEQYSRIYFGGEN
ncbi:hypothetical protein SH449x_000282 [Pirellulaceae bacterium SH449]